MGTLGDIGMLSSTLGFMLLPWLVLPLLGLLLVSFFLRWRRVPNSIGFFHPYSDDGGGGERVLWCAIAALHQAFPKLRVVVFTAPPRNGDLATAPIIKRAKDRFNVVVPGNVEFVFLAHRGWVEASSWPRFTMVGQSLGSVLLGAEAMLRFTPECFLDTMGYAFTMPLARWFCGCSTASYVHYPTISSEMEDMVSAGRAAHNNKGVAGSYIKTQAKLVYYRAFKFLYSVAGAHSQKVMVNSSWTHGHISKMWGAAQVVFPPCNVDQFEAIPLGKRERLLISIAQFRPEKDHPLQIRAFAAVLKRRPDPQIKLALIGSVRNQHDQDRVDSLKALALELGVGDKVEFRVNASFTQLLEAYGQAKAGLHTMWNEHFGIGVVEMMAAGLITIAHNSGGPKLDIVQPGTGFLASSVEEYSAAIESAFFEMSDAECNKMCEAARVSARRFTDQGFSDGFLESMAPLLSKAKTN